MQFIAFFSLLRQNSGKFNFFTGTKKKTIATYKRRCEDTSYNINASHGYPMMIKNYVYS